ncbi:conserved hypothetical protein [Ricinus communis]|uniref:Uncharacterized protein n=1 Tax=Ricinus communis TaxID=3988 RepID=B9RVB8_RICCO|nr:conserved hypothetical protein [Ricinus communis]
MIKHHLYFPQVSFGAENSETLPGRFIRNCNKVCSFALDARMPKCPNYSEGFPLLP